MEARVMAMPQGVDGGRDRSARGPVAATCLAVCALTAGLVSTAPAAVGKQDGPSERPNVVVVMSDDQTADSMRFMPQVNEQLGGQGATFANNFVNYSLCCPSRSTFLTGQYAHNHGVLSNQLPDGGFQKLDSTNTLAVWLQQDGYYTAHIGKYLNGYEQSPNVIPPGWTEWYGTTDTYRYYGYQINENGTLVDYGTSADQYQSDVFTQKAVDFINRRAPDSQPFFLSVAYLAPHSGGPNPNPQPPDNCQSTAKPAPRHAAAFESEPLPQAPSFNEQDVSDKPQEIASQPPLDDSDVANIQREYRCRLESLLGVDEGVAQIVAALRDRGELDNTLFVYTSDNGFFHGEHRIPGGKVKLYEESIRVPLIMRGPGVPAGVTVHDLSINADLAPTILELTGSPAGRTMDGLSLFGAMQDTGRLLGRALLVETRGYSAVRTARYIYAEYDTGERELYDLQNDPYELQSLHTDPGYAPVQAALANLLNVVRACAGPSCTQLPALKLKLDYKKGHENGHRCAEGAVRVILKGADRGLLIGADFRAGSKAIGSDDAAPFRVRVRPAELKKHGKTKFGSTATLVDGRVTTLGGRKVRRCG
jgi:N-acetylglucosamine-6-sulfatase